MLMNNSQDSKKTVYYQKQKGRYVPVREYDPDWLESRAYGTYITHVKQGARSTQRAVEPDFLALEAAALALKDQLADIALKASELRPSQVILTDRQRELWQQLVETGFTTVHYPAAYDVADQILKTITQAAQKTISENVCVRDLQEQYRAALILTSLEDRKDK